MSARRWRTEEQERSRRREIDDRGALDVMADVWGALKSRGLVDDSDLPPSTRERLAMRQSRRRGRR